MSSTASAPRWPERTRELSGNTAVLRGATQRYEVPVPNPRDAGGGVIALRPFVPAKNFEFSKRFYRDLGFRTEVIAPALVEMHVGQHSFLLQDFYVPEYAGNFVMHMLVDNVQVWWDRLCAIDLPGRYGLENPRAPVVAGPLKATHFADPSGILWHIAQPLRMRPK